jgi:deferrochelatase/peroxidase EfeB
MSDDRFRLSRRQLFGSSALASLGVFGAMAAELPASQAEAVQASSVAFHGPVQAGIATPAQGYLVFATFDVATTSSQRVRTVLDQWSASASAMAAGHQLPGASDLGSPPPDTGEAMGLGPANLTVTLGLGPTFFDAAATTALSKPAALNELPSFPGDQLDPSRSGGALCIQACADDPQVAFHAVHNLARQGLGTFALRNVQVGFGRTSSTTTSQESQRNLLGFKDGTNNLLADSPGEFARYVWVDEPEPSWMHGGTYLVARRIRTRLEQWTSSSLQAQQDAIGRIKSTGAPLGGHAEHDPVELAALGAHGLPIIPEGAHIRVAAPSENGGVRILRRGYSFVDGIDPVTGELDAGLFFIAFQKDPIAQFAALQHQLSRADALHAYLVHTSSGVFACPRGLQPGQGWGQQLFA